MTDIYDHIEGDQEQNELARLRKENDILRGIVAYSELPCVYCKLSKDDMGRCQLGFPGCARADDMLCSDLTELGWMFPDSDPQMPKGEGA